MYTGKAESLPGPGHLHQELANTFTLDIRGKIGFSLSQMPQPLGTGREFRYTFALAVPTAVSRGPRDLSCALEEPGQNSVSLCASKWQDFSCVSRVFVTSQVTA